MSKSFMDYLDKLKTAVYVIEYNAEHEARGLYPYHHQTLDSRMNGYTGDWEVVFRGSEEEAANELERLEAEYEKRKAAREGTRLK